MNPIDTLNDAIIEAGRAAFNSGIDHDENPYDHGTPEHDLWYIGWARAEAPPRKKHP